MSSSSCTCEAGIAGSKHHETLTWWDIFSLYGCCRPMPRFLYWSCNDILYIILIIFMQQIPKILQEPPYPSILMVCSGWKWSTFFYTEQSHTKLMTQVGCKFAQGSAKSGTDMLAHVWNLSAQTVCLYWGIMKLLHKQTDWRKITEWVTDEFWDQSDTDLTLTNTTHSTHTRSMLTLLASYDNIPMINTRWNFLLPSVWTNLFPPLLAF